MAEIRAPSVVLSALGYFACYAPYTFLTKSLTKGLLPGQQAALSGNEVLSAAVLASFFGGVAFLGATGWWRHATRTRIGPWDVPLPRAATLLSGLCTTAVVLTTTLAYTFEGVSIVFMMLLMRGGVLALAPIVDRISGRKVMPWSWISLGLSVGGLLTGVTGGSGMALPLLAAIDAAIYLGAYFLRLRLMSRLAKSDDPMATLRFFAEEQMVAVPAALVLLAAMAFTGTDIGGEILRGFTNPHPMSWLVGLLSMGTGIFGALVLLDRRENSFTVPLNRCSSVLAGLVSTLALYAAFDLQPPPASEWVGAIFIVGAILALSWPTLRAKFAGPS